MFDTLLIKTSSNGKFKTSNIFDSEDIECTNPKTFDWVNPSTKVIEKKILFRYDKFLRREIPARCGSNACRECSVLNARGIARALHASDPSHKFALTLVPEDRTDMARQVVRVFEDARRSIPSLRYAWSAELNPGGTGSHIHGFVHASKNDFFNIKKALNRSIPKITSRNIFFVGLIPKNASPRYFGYPMKSVTNPDLFDEFLEINGSPGHRSLIHASKTGFWRLGENGPVLRRRDLEVQLNKAKCSHVSNMSR